MDGGEAARLILEFTPNRDGKTLEGLEPHPALLVAPRSRDGSGRICVRTAHVRALRACRRVHPVSAHSSSTMSPFSTFEARS